MVFGFALLAVAHGLAVADESHVPPVSDAAFLSMLKSIADAGSLLSPEKIAETLGVSFKKTVDSDQQSKPACDKPTTGPSIQTTTMNPPASWWYQARASAPGKLLIPEAFINPASVSGDPKFRYEIRHVVKCSDGDGPNQSPEAKLSFDGLPGFACFSPEQIRAAIPGAAFYLATDGISFVDYVGRVEDDSGTSLSFLFRMGVDCALIATIEQSQRQGSRAVRARNARQK